MSDHKSALVPVATSQHQTPELFYKGIQADTGLFAESLIYYDKVYVHAGSPQQFAGFISLLIQQGLSYNELIRIVDEGIVQFLDTITIHPLCSRDPFTDLPHTRTIRNFIPIEEDRIKNPNYFESKFLDTEFLRNSFSNLSNFDRKAFNKFCHVAKTNSVVFDGDVVASGLVDNSYDDILNAVKYKLIAKNILDELFRVNGLESAPEFEVSIAEMDFHDLNKIAKKPPQLAIGREFRNEDYKIYEVNYNIPLEGLKDSEILERVFRTLPLSCAGISNLYIRSGGQLKCDFFLPTPISQIVGNKLYEISDFEISPDSLKVKNVIKSLKPHPVNFPDLRVLINNNQIDFNKVLEIRSKSKKFREWLQETGARSDHQIFWAYHNEVAKETGFTRRVRKILKLFGVVAPVVASTSVGMGAKYLSDDPGTTSIVTEITKSLVAKGTEKLFNYCANLGVDWKPVCFGDWTKHKIEKVLKK